MPDSEKWSQYETNVDYIQDVLEERFQTRCNKSTEACTIIGTLTFNAPREVDGSGWAWWVFQSRMYQSGTSENMVLYYRTRDLEPSKNWMITKETMASFLLNPRKTYSTESNTIGAVITGEQVSEDMKSITWTTELGISDQNGLKVGEEY